MNLPSTFDLFSPFKYFNIAPVTDWERFINPQFNITVNQGDAAIENRVLAKAGSYGKQIGRMQEVLDILVAQLPADKLNTVQLRSVEKYKELRAEVVDAVVEAKSGDETTATKDDVENWLDRLARLRDNDPDQFERLSTRIRQFLTAQGRTPGSRERGGR